MTRRAFACRSRELRVCQFRYDREILTTHADQLARLRQDNEAAKCSRSFRLWPVASEWNVGMTVPSAITFEKGQLSSSPVLRSEFDLESRPVPVFGDAAQRQTLDANFATS